MERATWLYGTRDNVTPAACIIVSRFAAQLGVPTDAIYPSLRYHWDVT
ncbi:hypothetical protein [Thiothrix winogradskyi]|uniref:Uncharacterized protein n=1 Tax=Thiothrix winogradskyi TaxID=96472 RepID=A0ABY3T3N4_9GAMM|nr:hypothetical protein [Thiothrix winogradskyi]UJS26462.1 hypothetical protein L2Y54_10580 [Thiothrix winogradskyi]